MLKKLQKHAPTISILLLIALLTALFFYPSSSQILSIIVIVFGIGTAVAFTVHGNWEKKKSDELTNSEFLRNTALDLLGLGAAMWLGRLAGGYAGQNWGMLAGILAGVIVGFISAFLVQRIWGKLSQSLIEGTVNSPRSPIN